MPIYIAAYNVNWTPYAHAYLVYDPDGDLITTTPEQEIIRGGPQNIGTFPPYGIITYEAGQSSALSLDGLDNSSQQVEDPSHNVNDKDDNNVVDTATDRSYTLHTAINSLSWTTLETYTQNLINIPAGYEHDYDPTGANSNSVINTVLNLSGINMWDVLPTGFTATDFPGITYLLDSAQNNSYTAYSNVTILGPAQTTFLKAGGSDRVTIEHDVANSRHGLLEVVNENDSTGLTTVYFQGLEKDDVTFDVVGANLRVRKGLTEELLFVDNYFSDRANNSMEGAATTAFEFEDYLYRRGNDDANTFMHFGLSKAVYVQGGGGNDVVFSGVQGDILYGDDGDDFLNALSGNDFLYGGDDNDNLQGSGGDDYLYGEDDDDSLSGGADNDRLWGGSGDDTLQGGDGHDFLYGGDDSDGVHGGSGNDYLEGNGGRDGISGGTGVDQLYGGAGDDVFFFVSGDQGTGVDTIHDFSSGDQIDISDLLSFYDPLTMLIEDFVQIAPSGGYGNLYVDTNGGGNSFIKIAEIVGGAGLDVNTMIGNGELVV